MERARQTRKNFIQLIEDLSWEDLNKRIPGFQNTIAWNFGHIVVSQQKLCYVPAGLPVNLSEEYISLFQKGTVTTRDITKEEIEDLKRLAYKLIDVMEEDIKNGLLDNYKPLQTHFGFLLTNINEAADFAAHHDGLHLGYALAQRRAIFGLKQNN